MSNRVFIKTDKNGTKIFHDYTCKRCGGLGASEAWRFTGMTCYECGGSGIAPKPSIIREYTPEYAAILAEKREARYQKQQAELRAKAEQLNSELLAEYFPDGKMYFLGIEDKFVHKIMDELKTVGVKLLGTTGLYYFTDRPEQFPVVEVTPDEALYTHDNGIKDFAWGLWKVVDAKIKALKPVSEWLGNVGEKICCKAVYESSAWYETKSFRGFGTDIVHVHTYRTQTGNILVWKTSVGNPGAEEGELVELTGTVKDHSEYKGEKQTVLTRCKIKQG